MALEPRTMKEAYWLAEQMANSRLFSRLGGPQACYMVLLRGRALGLDAMAAASAFHRIDDKITMHADLIAALVLRSGKAKFLEMVESDRTHATYETQRHGGRRVIAMTFTIEDAFHARLVEKHASGLDGYRGISQTGKPSNWDKYRATMLRHRCQTQLVRAVYPDVVLGLYTPDEMGHEDVIDTTIEAA
jgi:hypothetical protein